MFITESTLDDLLRAVLEHLLTIKGTVAVSRGDIFEVNGVCLELTNPRARLSHTERKGKLISSLGEWLWYLTKDAQLGFIEYYVPQYRTEYPNEEWAYGGYGPRLFSMDGQHDQIKNVLNLLTERPTSRRAVIQLFCAADIAEEHREVPCTCTMQFLIRDEQLHLCTYMRSNDAFLGLSHDVFAFTMIQEMLARSLGVELGRYKHLVGSLHLYERNREAAQQYIQEGYQKTDSGIMPPMPAGEPWKAIEQLLALEQQIRTGASPDWSALGLAPYWCDMARVLCIHVLAQKGDAKGVKMLRQQMNSKVFEAYIGDRYAKARQVPGS